MIKIIPKRFIHHVKKKEAYKIEKLPAPKPRPTPKRSSTHTEFFSLYTKKDRPRTCVICGLDAVYHAFFQKDGITLIEKYCNKGCLDKYVIYPFAEMENIKASVI